jgi:hypothetical protein
VFRTTLQNLAKAEMKRKWHKLLFVPVVIVAVLIGGMIIVAGIRTYKIRHSFNYFQHTHDEVSDRLMRTCLDKLTATSPMHDKSLLEPRYPDDKLSNWLSGALPHLLTFDESNVEQRILDDERYFTPNGWCHFIDGLLSADKIGLTIAKKISTTLVVRGSPKIKKAADENGAFVWYVETPVSLEYHSAIPGIISTPSRNATITTTITRSLYPTNPDGLGISEVIPSDSPQKE